MTAHRPKTAALIAYAEGLLSPKGRARVERHLAGCPRCRRELAAVMLYEQMADEAREAPVPDVDFDGMEMTLAREAQRISQEIRIVERGKPWAWIGLAAAAAAALAVYAAWPAPEAPVATEQPTEPSEEPRDLVAPARAPLAPVVTLAAGSAERIGGGEALELSAGDSLHEGQTLRTGSDGVAHVRLADGTGFAIAANTELALTAAREGTVELTLEHGRVDNTVAALESGSTYVVLCAGYRVEVRGTRFVVSWLDDVVGVDLAEGSVVVQVPDGAPVELSAPARWRSNGEGDPSAAEPSVVAPRALIAPSEAPTEVTIAHPELVRWEIDATSFDGGGPVRLLLSEGEHELRGWDARGRLFSALVPVSGAALAIEPSALSPEPPRLRPGHLPPEEINRVLRQADARLRLRGCYERTLRDNPQVYGRLRVRVTLGVMGDVRRVAVQGADGSEAAHLRDCISRVASGWIFPPPGGPVTFEVPLALSSRP